MANKVLVIIDMQTGFRRSVSVSILVGRLVELLEAKIFDKVIATKFILTDYSPVKNIYGWEGFRFANDYDIIDELKPYIDITVTKSVYSCVDKDFLNILKSVNDGIIPSEVYIAGCDTDVCVLSSAVDLFETGIRPIVLHNYCTSCASAEHHKAATKCLIRSIGREQISFAYDIDRMKEGIFFVES